MGGVSDAEERLARAALSRLVEPATVALTRHVAAVGAVTAWEQLRAGRGPAGLQALVAARLDRCDPVRDLDGLRRLGGRLLCPGDPDWPTPVDDLGELAPVALWVRGPLDLAVAAGRAVAVVGARAATAYGEYAAAELATGLAGRGWTVISGGAYGIDAAAHRGALAGGGATVAVLACGVDVPYPRGNAALFDRIAATGALLSEWAPGCSPQRPRFLVRNRVIAGLAAGTVVVEAAHRSGARRTANDALALGREVMAVPGPVNSALSAGTHALIRSGAALVADADDVVEQVSPVGEGLAPVVSGPVQPRDALESDARRVLEATPVRRTATPAAIARTAGIEVTTVLRELGRLARQGWVVVDGEGWRTAERAPARPPARSPGWEPLDLEAL